MKVVWIFIFCLPLLLAKSKCENCPYPNFWPLENAGCEITEKRGTPWVAGGWYVRVHAEKDQEKWSALLAVQTSRSKALKDCDEWLTCVTKWQKEQSKPQAK